MPVGGLREEHLPHQVLYPIHECPPPSCQILQKDVFSARAAFIFFTAILSEFYYVSYLKAKEGSVPPYGGCSALHRHECLPQDR